MGRRGASFTTSSSKEMLAIASSRDGNARLLPEDDSVVFADAAAEEGLTEPAAPFLSADAETAGVEPAETDAAGAVEEEEGSDGTFLGRFAVAAATGDDEGVATFTAGAAAAVEEEGRAPITTGDDDVAMPCAPPPRSLRGLNMRFLLVVLNEVEEKCFLRKMLPAPWLAYPACTRAA